VGEWTDWVPFDFELMPTQALPAMARFYLQALDPELQLYVSPINFDPLQPAMPISHPEEFAAELAEATGRYYTQGMPEDTQALKGEVIDREEFLAQAAVTRDEMLAQYPRLLEDFDGGILFYYMGTADQVSHMLWDTLDPTHPQYDEVTHAPLADVIPSIYEQLDRMVGHTLDTMPPDTLLVVMSDHGFTSWKRAFNLNSWLRDEGYIVLKDPSRPASGSYFGNVDWAKTRAYGVGINGLYVNLRGREKNGVVPPEEKAALVREIGQKLLATLDPQSGGPAVTKVYPRDEYFTDRGHLEVGPDLLVGYAKGTRASSESSLGELTEEVFADNLDDWPGDHLMDHETVPGVLLSNRRLKRNPATLLELAGALLAEIGIEGFPAARGDG
jgi:predicted AlkP superfamily phosphohydrolase/phosphomutase